jgi:hypothetical protein
MCTEPGAHRIEDDVPAYLEEVSVTSDGLRVVAALKD